MKKYFFLKSFFCLTTLLFFCIQSFAQKPDLSLLQNDQDKITAWLNYCEFLKSNTSWQVNNHTINNDNLQEAAQIGLQMTSPKDPADRSRFYYYAAYGFFFNDPSAGPMDVDSIEYYFNKSLGEAQKANSALLIQQACIALLHTYFEMGEPGKIEKYKTILQTIIDTTNDKTILVNGYAALGNYYQQKSYYSTAQDYMLKSIELKKAQIDTTKNKKIRLDYANECYTLAELYMKSSLPDKALNMLYEGQQYSSGSLLVKFRYQDAFINVFSKTGNIDSALYYLVHYIQPQEAHFKNSLVVPAETIFPYLNISQYYLDVKQYEKALPYLDKAFNLAAKSNEQIYIYETQIMRARYFVETGKYAAAIPLLSKSLPVARQFSKEKFTNGLKYMALAQKGIGNAPLSLKYFEQYSMESDSLVKERLSTNFADQETRYETKQKEQSLIVLGKENKLHILELQNATRTKLLLITGLVGLGIISFLSFLFYRNKEKVNKILNMQNEQLEILNNQLVIANETKAKLFSIISHDLRSPVSQIVQLLQLQKENPNLFSKAMREQYDAKLKSASENVLDTMEDLLLWSKSQMQNFTPQEMPVNISAIMQKELELLMQVVEQNNLIIKNTIAENILINTDENFLSVIIRNLLQNAINHSNPGGTIHISADTNNIFIENYSLDANAENLNALLGSKVINSKTSGLGLQIANDLALSIQAKIIFEQKPGNKIVAAIKWLD